MKILLLTRYSVRGASSRLRSIQYIPFLKAAGIETVLAPLLDDEYLANLYSKRPINKFRVSLSYFKRAVRIASAARYDLLWIEYELFPWMPAWVEQTLKFFGVRYIVDYDDAVFHRYDEHPNAIVRLLLGRKIDRVMNSAAAVIAGNQYIADRAMKSRSKTVHIVPTVIDLDRYHSVKQWEGENPSGPLRIGWIGSPTTAKNLSLIDRPLAMLAKAFPIDVVLIGAGNFELPSIKCRIVEWTKETELDSLLKLDIGIMPLFDLPFERGKCGFKLIQYFAVGIPVIASPVGINRQLVDSQVGFLAKDDDEWLQALTTLAESLELRRALGRNGRFRAESIFSIQAQFPRIVSILRQSVNQTTL